MAVSGLLPSRVAAAQFVGSQRLLRPNETAALRDRQGAQTDERASETPANAAVAAPQSDARTFAGIQDRRPAGGRPHQRGLTGEPSTLILAHLMGQGEPERGPGAARPDGSRDESRQPFQRFGGPASYAVDPEPDRRRESQLDAYRLLERAENETVREYFGVTLFGYRLVDFEA